MMNAYIYHMFQLDEIIDKIIHYYQTTGELDFSIEISENLDNSDIEYITNEVKRRLLIF